MCTTSGGIDKSIKLNLCSYVSNIIETILISRGKVNIIHTAFLIKNSLDTQYLIKVLRFICFRLLNPFIIWNESNVKLNQILMNN